MSQSIIIDACGWVAVIDSGMNIDIELEKIFGSFELILLESVLEELKQIEDGRPKRKTLLIPMLESKSKLIENTDFKHTDDQIFSISEEYDYAVLTVDKDLKKRLYKSSIKVIEVNKNNHLNIIENL
jgi:rRNA-processing protein FCF1|tara:strand:- start:940 stop:1320 length:381 start_codon:yes stop_codon:yes gene_type:complete